MIRVPHDAEVVRSTQRCAASVWQQPFLSHVTLTPSVALFKSPVLSHIFENATRTDFSTVL